MLFPRDSSSDYTTIPNVTFTVKKYYLESRSRRISYTKLVNARLTGLVTFCVETAFYDIIEGKTGGIEVTGR
jgi:hypothetical protein